MTWVSGTVKSFRWRRLVFAAALGFGVVVLVGLLREGGSELAWDDEDWGEVRLMGVDFDQLVAVPPEGATIEAFFRRYPIPRGISSIELCFNVASGRWGGGLEIGLEHGFPAGMPELQKYRIAEDSQVRFVGRD